MPDVSKEGEVIETRNADAAVPAEYAPTAGAPSDARTRHAARLIAEWREYLPEACVQAMIRDGWPLSDDASPDETDVA